MNDNLKISSKFNFEKYDSFKFDASENFESTEQKSKNELYFTKTKFSGFNANAKEV